MSIQFKMKAMKNNSPVHELTQFTELVNRRNCNQNNWPKPIRLICLSKKNHK